MTARKRNPRNIKLDIPFQNSNLRIVGAGMDTNGNSVIRFGFPNKRAFSIQADAIKSGRTKRDLMVRGTLSEYELAQLEKRLVAYIKAHGSAAQKKSLRVYKREDWDKFPRKRNPDNPVDWRGAGRKAWGGAKGAAAKAAHAAKLAKARTKVRAAESKIKSLKSCAVDLDVFPSELASTKAMKAAQRSLTTAKDDVKKIQAAKPKKIKGGTPPKGQEEDVSWYLYDNPGKGRKSTKRKIAKKNAPTRRTNARNPTYKKGDRVYVTKPDWGKPFYGTIGATMTSDGKWGHPKGTKLYLIGRSPTSGASMVHDWANI